ncbi:hypothetical protein GC207_13815 [bacterium]|nr:hypothetical protein [bacterium]
MQARFLLGPAGSGKTFRCLAEIRSLLMNDPLGPPLILLAPRQATYQLELALLSKPELTGYTRLQIVSFERFAVWLLQRLNMRPRAVLSAEGRVMVLRALLHQHHESLKVFRESSRSVGFAQLLSDQLEELQQYQVSPADLRKAAERSTSQNPPADKLRDLALLLEKYLEWLADRNLPDAGSLLDQAVEGLRNAGKRPVDSPLQIAGLWLDGMAELTPQELDLLVAIAPFCASATIAFCLESEPMEDEPWLSTWSVISQTFRRCHTRFAASDNCQTTIEVIPRRGTPSRFSHGTRDTEPTSIIEQLEANWTAGKSSSANADAVSMSLQLVECATPEQEATFAAREILRFVQAGNRFRDCAVLLRQMDTHYADLRRAFTRYEIPFFLDRRESVAHHPLVEFTSGALHTVLFHWRTADWFSVLKTGLTPLDADEVDHLENAALTYGWEGGKWLNAMEIADNPALATRCESMRRRVISPFEKLREQIFHEPSGSDIAGAIRRLGEEFDVAGKLEEWAAAGGETSIHLTVYDELTGWLENLEKAFGGFTLPLREWLPIIESGLSTLTVGVIPPAIDQVLIGAVDRSRNPDLKLAIVLGLNEGIFPQPQTRLTLLTETDRAAMEDAQLNLRNDAKARLGHERYLGYIAFTRAREHLVLSWSNRDHSGKVLNRSPLVDHVQKLFPSATIQKFDNQRALSDAVHPCEILGYLARLNGTNESAEISDAEIDTQSWPEVRAVLDHVRACADIYRTTRLSSATATALYGNPLRTSASRLEQFAACPFQFFAIAGLRARERDRFEVDARKTGTFMHEVLRQFHEELAAKDLRWRDIASDEARKRIAVIATEQRTRVANGVLASDPRHVFQTESMISLLQDFVATAIDWMRTYQFDPIAVELGIGRTESDLPAWEIDLGDGRTLAFRGSVDRVDAVGVPGRDDALCLTVLDYKSGNKKFEPLKMQAGLQLQLPAYLAALCEVASGTAFLDGKKAIAAGMFYVRLKDAGVRASHREDEIDAKAVKRFEHSGRFSFAWLSLFDRDFASCGSGQFTYKLKKDGEPSGTSKQLVHQPEFEGMLAGAKELICALGRDILAGNISVDPYRKGSEMPCTYCDFKSVCRIDPWTHAYRPLRPIVDRTEKSAAALSD